MRIKLDENIGARGVTLFRAAGHDVATVREQDLCGADDPDLTAACASERRCLVTLDLDFANALGQVEVLAHRHTTRADLAACFEWRAAGLPAPCYSREQGCDPARGCAMAGPALVAWALVCVLGAPPAVSGGAPSTSPLEVLELEAARGDVRAQCKLARCLARGDGVPRNVEEAFKWFRKAADQGAAEGQVGVGDAFAGGYAVPKDEVEAVAWYRKAADQNSARAQFELGLCYANGRGVPKDAAEAVAWYRLAADQGHAGAQHNLGLCYGDGEGVPRDAVEAVTWYRKAAGQRSAPAQYSLGYCYSKGEGVPKDSLEALKWYRQAADQGNASAQFAVGACYAKGEGVPRDYAEAYVWFSLAAATGNAKACAARDRVEQDLPPGRLAEAKARVATMREAKH